MFFFFPFALSPVLIVYILAAILPAFFLLRYIYRQDSVEKEPFSLLVSLLLVGVLSALCAGFLEQVGTLLLGLFLTEESGLSYTAALAFIVVALSEEGMKLFFLRKRTWHNPHFNYRFDAIVYAVFVSLGFAAYENVLYVFGYGLSVALPRALLAIPGHMSFSVFMGVFYGRARLCEDRGNYRGCKRNLRSALIFPALLHGFYDTCAMVNTNTSTLVLLGFVAVMYLTVFLVIRRASVTDHPF